MHVLVTGGAGFIGSHLVECLLAEGHVVTVLDNFDPYYPPTLKRQTFASLMAGAPSGRLSLVEGDIRRDADLNRAMRVAGNGASLGPDVIVHLAALAGVRPSCQRPAAYTAVNVTGTTRLLEAARRSLVRRLVFASSSSVYGETSTVPFRETDPCGAPISPYAATKRAGELLCHAYAHLYGMRILCARLFTVYGPRQRPDLAIHKFCRSIAAGKPIALFGDGSTRRDYTYVSDIVAGLRRAMDWTASEGAGFEIVNLGGAQAISLIGLVRHLERLLGREAAIDWQPEQPGDVPLTFADTGHAHALLGYRPRVPIHEGLERFVTWFSSGEWTGAGKQSQSSAHHSRHTPSDPLPGYPAPG